MTSEERACTRAYAVGNEAHLKTLSSLVRPTPKPMKAASPSTIQMAENGALGEGVRHPYAVRLRRSIRMNHTFAERERERERESSALARTGDALLA